MMLERWTRTGIAGAAALVLAGLVACGDTATPPTEEEIGWAPALATVSGLSAPVTSEITVCKHGTDGHFDVDLIHPDRVPFVVWLTAGGCQVVYTAVLDDGLRKRQRLSVLEHPMDGTILDSIVVVEMNTDGRIRKNVILGSPTALLSAVAERTGTTATFYNRRVVRPNEIVICKIGTDGDFDVDLVHPDRPLVRHSLTDGECRVVYTLVVDDGLLKKQTLSVKEFAPPGTRLDSIVVTEVDGEGRSRRNVYLGTDQVMVSAVALRTGTVAIFYNTRIAIVDGG